MLNVLGENYFVDFDQIEKYIPAACNFVKYYRVERRTDEWFTVTVQELKNIYYGYPKLNESQREMIIESLKISGQI